MKTYIVIVKHEEMQSHTYLLVENCGESFDEPATRANAFLSAHPDWKASIDGIAELRPEDRL